MATVLVVEDEEQVRVLAESFLQGEGHTTLSAATEEQALALLEGQDTIDLLFVDLTIQGDPEAGAALASRAVELRPDLKVLYTSAQGATDGMMALFVKNSAFLPKPYTVDQLTAIMLVKFGLGGTTPNKLDPKKPDGPALEDELKKTITAVEGPDGKYRPGPSPAG